MIKEPGEIYNLSILYIWGLHIFASNSAILEAEAAHLIHLLKTARSVSWLIRCAIPAGIFPRYIRSSV
mgnify:CR=1 FL=1